jgi:selenide,water dikinase
MHAAPLPLVREVVLIGGGHTHALVLQRWGMNPLAGARLTVINPDPTAPYTGMLPGHIAGHYSRDALDIDLVRLARHAGARVILGRGTGLDRDAQMVHVTGRPPVHYDIISVDVGATSAMPGIPGFTEHAIPAKPLGKLAEAWRSFVADPPEGPRLAVIGGGVAGAELALAMAWRLRDHVPSIDIIEAKKALRGVSPRGRRILVTRLKKAGITLHEDARVVAVGPDAVRLEDREIPSHFTVGSAGARPPAMLAETGLHLTDGYITVDEMLRSVSDPSVYAVGDCAHLAFAPRPKAGVFAVRQAPILYANLRADLAGRARRRYRPQRDFLKLVSLGRKSALADKFGMAVAAPALWRWKDRIDRRFMDRFSALTPMPQPELPGEHVAGIAQALGPKPLCGGCGAKVGGNPLGEALGGIGDDAAILPVGTATQVLSTDHLRAVTEDPWVMARIAANHALGDIWAMGARPQAALSTVILPRMTPELQRAWLSEIIDGARSVFGGEGAEIVGGHTSLGAELTIGFTVTGLCDREPITLAGARPGDVLVLTKPVGSGTILAAEMQLAARGAWVAGCLAAMQVSQGAAGRVLANARAMTDVTGFGLAGHLANLARTSGVSAEIDVAAVPFLPGAVELADRGIRSTLFDANLSHAFSAPPPSDPRAALLYDPQTAGGLLAAVPAEDVEETMAALRSRNHEAARIGLIDEGPPALRLL